MEGEVGQVAIYDSLSCGSPSFHQYQFLPGKGCDSIFGAKQAAQSDRLNLNFENTCSSYGEERFSNGTASIAKWKSRNSEGLSFMAQSNPEMTSPESDVAQNINPVDLRLASADFGSGGRDDSRGAFATEQKRRQNLFSSRSSTHHIDSMSREDTVDEAAGSLSLKLFSGSFAYTQEIGNSPQNPKRYRSSSPGSQSPICQVDDCHADLKHAKDYHRRHKVCEMHSKASHSLVHGLMQRFCQQCSRFHPLLEFDEGKRSCRRRLAGHNKRRRKPHPEVAPAGVLLSDAVRGSELLRILAILLQLQSTNAKEKPSEERDSILQGLKKTNFSMPASPILTRDTAAVASTLNFIRQTLQNLPGGQKSDQESQTRLLAALASLPPEALSLVLQSSFGAPVSPKVQEPHVSQCVPYNDQRIQPHLSAGLRSSQELQRATGEAVGHSNIQHTVSFDLSETSGRLNGSSDISKWPSGQGITRQYLGLANSQPLADDSGSIPVSNPKGTPEQSFFPIVLRNGTASRMNGEVCNSGEMEKCQAVNDSANQTRKQGMGRTVVLCEQPSDNSDSGSDQSPASSSSDWQERSGRIIFKLFDKKDPGDFPQNLRAELQEWLNNFPSGLESYARAGCILLTVFLTMPRRHWEELVANLQENLERLLRCSSRDFWRKGKILVQVEQQRALVVDGVVREIQSWRSINSPILKAVRPLAVMAGQVATLAVSGQNLVPEAKILCVYHGEYVLHEIPSVGIKAAAADFCPGSSEGGECDGQVQMVHFPGGPANVLGRCYIEVEHDLLGNILPVIVADSAICTELRSLERELDASSPRKSKNSDELSSDDLSINKETEAMTFLHELGWMFQRTCSSSSCSSLDITPHSPFKLSRFKALLKYAVLHDWCAVVKKLLDLLFSIGVKENGSSYVEVLDTLSEVNLVHQAVKRRCKMMVELLLQYRTSENESRGKTIFTPVMEGPSGLTPLHVAASISNAEEIVDALTSDPSEGGLYAWKEVCDHLGRTAEWHAFNSGNVSYIQLIDRKLTRRRFHCVSVTIGDVPEKARSDVIELSNSLAKPKTPAAFYRGCKTRAKLHHSLGTCGGNGRMYRPLMLMMVTVATLCAAVALLLQGPPHLDSIGYSLKWETIEYGPW